MLLKLALRNVRRSVKDYAIYFLTLIFAVAVFYSFNSIGEQQVLFDLESEASARQFSLTQGVLNLFSWLITFVLAFLVIYANRFLIRRRKREFGTYLVLGMTPRSVSLIVLLETALVGVVALLVGLVVGLLLSQGLSFLTAYLFGTTLQHYQFVLAPQGVLMTVACFIGIFAVVAIFNTISVNYFKLIDLLHAGDRNERGGVRNPWVCLAVFILSILVLWRAYSLLIECGMIMLDDPRFIKATVAMLVGTLGFFWSLAGFVIAVITRVRGVYFRGLTMFTVRQIASRVNTAFLSLWAVCVLLFFSITTFSIGMGLVQIFTEQQEEGAPYDATLIAQVWRDDPSAEELAANPYGARAQEMQNEAPERWADAAGWQWDMAAKLAAGAPELWAQTVAASAQVNFYEVPTLTYGELYERNGVPFGGKESTDAMVEEASKDANLAVMSLHDFNAARALLGLDPVELADNQCLLDNSITMAEDLAQSMVEAKLTVPIEGYELQLEGPVETLQMEDSSMKSTAIIFVVPDGVVESLKAQGVIPRYSVLNITYVDNGQSAEAHDKALAEIVAASQPLSLGGFEKGSAGADDPYASLLWPVSSLLSQHELLVQASGLRLMITYLALYIGFVLLIATAAILAIQQLSEAADSAPRYRTLECLGCSAPMISRSVLVQVLIYFLLPLGLALCHSACAIGVMADSLFRLMMVPVAGPIGLAALLVLVVYGGYLVATYAAARSVALSALKEQRAS